MWASEAHSTLHAWLLPKLTHLYITKQKFNWLIEPNRTKTDLSGPRFIYNTIMKRVTFSSLIDFLFMFLIKLDFQCLIVYNIYCSLSHHSHDSWVAKSMSWCHFLVDNKSKYKFTGQLNAPIFFSLLVKRYLREKWNQILFIYIFFLRSILVPIFLLQTKYKGVMDSTTFGIEWLFTSFQINATYGRLLRG